MRIGEGDRLGKTKGRLYGGKKERGNKGVWVWGGERYGAGKRKGWGLGRERERERDREREKEGKVCGDWRKMSIYCCEGRAKMLRK